jgi:hypothetical protein
MPVIENCEYNNDMVMLPWYDKEFKYAEASRICAEKIVDFDYVDYVVILCGDNLTDSEKDFVKVITRLCVVKNKYFWKIGNSCECFNIDNLVQWINDKENCSCYFKDAVNIIDIIGV